MHERVMRHGFFFFQAEDGIRDLTVTGVQTCALPICSSLVMPPDILLPRTGLRCILGGMDYHHVLEAAGVVVFGLVFYSYTLRWFEPKGQIGRASCRERV